MNRLKYFLYSRKSQTDEGRQVLSIQSQKDKAQSIFPDLNIIEMLEESQTAYEPNKRTVFYEMLERIKNGEADGIIAWHPDRLSRNEMDAAQITYLVRTGVIKDLKFGSYNFDNSPEGIMMLQLALSQSQYFSSKLSKDVRRGRDTKIKKGIRPCKAPQGWLNDYIAAKGLKTIHVDEERFPLLRKVWEMVLSENYSPPQALKILNEEWGYKSLKTLKTGGKPMGRATIYAMLSNPFYCGLIETQEGEWIKGIHKPMVTEAEYEKVQRIVKGKNNARAKRHTFCYKVPFLKCGECKGFVTAEYKYKKLKNGTTKMYTFYHCTHNVKGSNCKQGSINEEEITAKIMECLSQYTIIPEFQKWALDMLEKYHLVEVKSRNAIKETQEKALHKKQVEIDGLTLSRARGEVEGELYNRLIKQLQKDKSILKESYEDSFERERKWTDLTRETFNFIEYAPRHFKEGGMKERRAILRAFASNVWLKDKKLYLEPHPWLLPIKEEYQKLEVEYHSFELDKTLTEQQKEDKLYKVCLNWRNGRDSNPRPPQ